MKNALSLGYLTKEKEMLIVGVQCTLIVVVGVDRDRLETLRDRAL